MPGENFGQITDIPVIDSHVHVFPAPVFRAIWAWFRAHAWACRYELPSEEVVALGRRAGAAGQLLLVYAHKPGVARGFNEMLAALLRGAPDLRGLAAVHPADDDPAGIVKEALGRPGVVGIKLHCHVMGLGLDHPCLEPILEACLRRGAWVNAHAGSAPALGGYGLDVRGVSGPARVERVLRRRPGLRLIVPHLGMDEPEAFYGLLEHYPNLMLDTAMLFSDEFDAAVDPALLERHHKRVLFGTDAPNIPHALGFELERLCGLGLSRHALEAILHRNAERAFGFPAGLRAAP